MNFELGTKLDDEGFQVPAYGFTHRGVFITDPTISECGRFAMSASDYGMTEADAAELESLNAGLIVPSPYL